MKLTRYSDYALRVSLYLAVHRDRLVSISEITEAYAIPRSNVMKLVTDLVGAGIFASVRGRMGGIRLACAPSDLTVGRILRRTEGSPPMVDCTGCILNRACGLICIMGEARAAFFTVLDGYSLQDVIDKEPGVLAYLRAGDGPDPLDDSAPDVSQAG